MENHTSQFNSVTDQNSKVEAVINYAKGILGDMSDYELGIIRDSMRIVTMEPPSTKLLVTERINQINKAKSDMQYIVLKTKEVRRNYNIPFVNNYNNYYTLGTKKGLPSKQAIDSEIFYLHPDMREYRDKIEEIDTILEFFQSYFGFLDKTISTLESRKFDL
jgi:hypothetical protein